jgi:hypothetical protein
MFSCVVRFLIFMIVCLAIVHAYPPSMSRTKWVNIFFLISLMDLITPPVIPSRNNFQKYFCEYVTNAF